ncbi:MAG: cyclase [Acidobacteria bacterium]|nr:MAG: cyclase [Acidobacteriota bacterium]
MPEQSTKSIIVGAGAAEVFAAWADFENFPRFMDHLKSVSRTGERTTRWVAHGPLGQDIEWEAETTRFEPDKRIAWRSTEESQIKTSGQVTFNELSPQQTEITVTLQYVVPNVTGGEKVARLFKDPEEMLEGDLRRFKAWVENRVPAAR